MERPTSRGDRAGFFINGLVNNFVYVVFLSAASDILLLASKKDSGGSEEKLPEGIVLLADIIPSLLVKSFFPHIMHRFPYGWRIVFCAALSLSALQMVAWSTGGQLALPLVGIVLASISSGMGEVSFLSLSSFYPAAVVGFWGSGTGAAGLVGSLAYLALTTWLQLSMRNTLIAISPLPILMPLSYWLMMSKPHNQRTPYLYQIGGDEESGIVDAAGVSAVGRLVRLFRRPRHGVRRRERQASRGYQTIEEDKEVVEALVNARNQIHGSAQESEVAALITPPQSASSGGSSDSPQQQQFYDCLSGEDGEEGGSDEDGDDNNNDDDNKDDGIDSKNGNTGIIVSSPGRSAPFKSSRSDQSSLSPAPSDYSPSTVAVIPPEQLSMINRFRLVISPLIRPFMIPLFLVFWAEYTINQGVAPVLLFPLQDTPFRRLRDHYVYYQCMYQLGVFISRSSLSWCPIRNIWALSLLQVATLLALVGQAMLFSTVPSSLYLILCIILWEGLLGGAAYVNAFHQISTKVPPAYREFSMGVTALADTLGITLAGLTAIIIKPLLCRWQADHDGRPLCLQID